MGIKGHFEKNETLRYFYGEHVSKDKWAATEIKSAQATTVGQKDATISVIGAKGSITGARSRIQYCDDLVSLKILKQMIYVLIYIIGIIQHYALF